MSSLVEKWELSGLLTNASNKEELSQTLECAAHNLVYVVSKNSTEEATKTAGVLIFPTIRRVLGNKEFSFVEGQDLSAFTRESVSVAMPLASSDEEAVCESISNQMSERLQKYGAVKVANVTAEQTSTGVDIHFYCA